MKIMIGAALRGRPQQYRRELEVALRSTRLTGVELLFDCHDEDDVWSDELAACEALVLTSRGLARAAVERGARLRFVQKLGIVTERVDLAACRERGVAVSVLSDAGHVAVAEHTLMCILACSRGLVRGHEAVRAGANPRRLVPVTTTQTLRYPNWLRDPEESFRPVAGSTLGLIGLGEIGREVASRARAFGMRVLYTTRHRLAGELESRLGAEYAELPTLLRAADFVSLHATQPDDAPPLLGAAELALMGPQSVLVNTSRGNQIDQATLVERLRSRAIRAAALDVFTVEPVPAETFAGLDNVLLSPHTAGVMPLGRRFAEALVNIEAHSLGQPVRGLV